MERLNAFTTVKSASGKGRSLALAAIASTILLAASASAAPAPGQTQQVAQACGTIMGFSPATAEYAACSASLTQSLTGAETATALADDRSACLRQGLAPDTAKFGLCIVDRENAAEIGR